MTEALLKSQFDALEEPDSSEVLVVEMPPRRSRTRCWPGFVSTEALGRRAFGDPFLAVRFGSPRRAAPFGTSRPFG